MPRGFMYLTAVMDWHSRKVLSWRLSNTIEVGFCVEALTEALEKYGVPEVFNTDQGSQFTSEKFTQVLKDHQIKISMDGKGRWVDNVMIERLWRSVKYECVYINVYESGSGLRLGLKDWFESYNADRPHQGLNDRTPDEVYFGIKSAGCLQSNIA
jgi:putative transposase